MVDESLDVEGYSLHLTQASLEAGAVEGLVLKMAIDPQPGLIGVGLTCQDLKVCSSSGFELGQPGQPLQTEVYLDQLPGRAVDLKVQTLMEMVHGPWEISFQLADASHQ